MKPPATIIKRVLHEHVHLRLRGFFHRFQVLDVLTILLEEMIRDLKEGKEIKIHNLGTLQLVKTKPRMHCDITQGNRSVLSKGSWRLQFQLLDRIAKRLRGLIDLDKTFGRS
jgi:nucleoid DNA-binding protein